MEGSRSVYKLERVSEVVGVCPALRTGVVAVGHAAALRYEGAGGAGAQLELQVLTEVKYFYCSSEIFLENILPSLALPGCCRYHHRPGLTGETLPDGGRELWPTADSFKLRPAGIKYVRTS